jgi:hypothetical protein
MVTALLSKIAFYFLANLMTLFQLHGTHTKSHPQFPGLVLPSDKKLTLGLLAAITLEVVPFCEYARFLAFLPFLKCIMEIVFCEGV